MTFEIPTPCSFPGCSAPMEAWVQGVNKKGPKGEKAPVCAGHLVFVVKTCWKIEDGMPFEQAVKEMASGV